MKIYNVQICSISIRNFLLNLKSSTPKSERGVKKYKHYKYKNSWKIFKVFCSASRTFQNKKFLCFFIFFFSPPNFLSKRKRIFLFWFGGTERRRWARICIIGAEKKVWNYFKTRSVHQSVFVSKKFRAKDSISLPIRA